MLLNHPFAARLLPRLLYQLVPAALVTTIGVLLLSNLAKVPDMPPATAPVETAINTEAVFKIVPREVSADAEQDSKPVKGAPSRTAVNAKSAASGTPQSRKPASEPAAPRQVSGAQIASVPPPLQIVEIPEQPQAAAAAPDNENVVMSKLRSATTTVQRIPQWAARSVAGWFAAADAPPRPPASVPAQNFQAAM